MIGFSIRLAVILCITVGITGFVLDGVVRNSLNGNCAELTNRGGMSYTVRVEVGTPPQIFDLIIDTGSSSTIIEDCQCKNSGYCAPSNKCFNRDSSTTLSIPEGPYGPTNVIMQFGSGPIQSVLATDLVRIDTAMANMSNGLLLMVDQLLSFSGPFEGIMGLGLPNPDNGPTSLRSASNVLNGSLHSARQLQHGPPGFPVRETQGHRHTPIIPMPVPMKTKDDHSDIPEYIWTAPIQSPDPNKNPLAGYENEFAADNSSVQFLDTTPIDESGFLKTAGIQRFSLCFDGTDHVWSTGGSGALRFNQNSESETLANIGTMHWGIDFRGVSVGANGSTLAKFCNLENMPAGQETPCAAIIDSGTTYIMGPTQQVLMVYEDLCDSWTRCKDNHTAMVEAANVAKQAAIDIYGTDPWNIQAQSKSSTFSRLLSSCDEWMDDVVGINELPSLYFHVAGSGRNKALKLDPWSFVVATQSDEVWNCQPAFGSLSYPTAVNGNAWIIGMPLFYSYVVEFDLGSTPYTMAFNEEPCQSCSGGGGQGWSTLHAARTPRRLHGTPRALNLDTSMPF